MNLASASCALCAEEGGTLIWRNDVLRVVEVEEPGLPGYTRIIWQRHLPEMTDLGAHERQLLMQAVFLVESMQRRILQADKVNLASLGNMTPHLHWHIMPRWHDDPWFPDSIWSPRRDRNPVDEASWQEHRRTLTASLNEYTTTLHAALEQHFGSTDPEAGLPPQGRTERNNVETDTKMPTPRNEETPPDRPERLAEPAGTSQNQLREPPGQQLPGLHPGWRAALDTAPARDALARLDQFIAQRLQQGATIYPARVFRTLETLAPEDVRVVILGQDPYHGPGQAQGLAFSVPDNCPAPPSLRNIFNELAREYPDRPARRHNDLSDWLDQGVLLLNTSLTVEQGAAGSHARKGWEAVTDALIDAVASSPHPKVFLLWGNHAQSKQAALEAKGQSCKIFRANHPSPLSALRPPRPFIGCGHFSQANAWLSAMGQKPIDWL